MSFRDVLVNAASSGFQKIAIVSQIKGNPSKIEIYDEKGKMLLFLKITISLLNLKGKVNVDALSIRCEIEELKKPLINILNIPENKGTSNRNLVWIQEGEGENKVILEFYDKDGSIRDPRIYIKNWRFE